MTASTLSFKEHASSLFDAVPFDFTRSSEGLAPSPGLQARVEISYFPATLEQAVDSGIKIVRQGVLKFDAQADADFRQHVGKMAEQMSDEAWDRWVVMKIARKLVMGGVKTIGDFSALPLEVRQGVDAEMAAALKPHILNLPALQARREARTSADESVKFEDYLRTAEALCDAELPIYTRFIDKLSKLLPVDSEAMGPLLRICAKMKTDCSVRHSAKSRS